MIPSPRRWWLPLLGLPLGLLPTLSRAQVVDDSTKVLYGPKTTLVVREVDVLRNQPDGHPLDTTLTGMHNSRNWYYDSTFQQSLGNVALASRRLLWETNTRLGARVGRNAFDRYFRDPATIPYYDTRSPYTFFRFVQGGVGEQVFEAAYTRSIKKAVNVGVAYERFGANKQLGTTNNRDPQVTHAGVLVFARYQTKNERYHVLLNYYEARHRAIEQGGIKPRAADGDTLTNLFDYRSEDVWLRQAQNKDHRDQFHLTHTYNLVGKGLTAYHLLDWRRQYNRYTDDFAAGATDRDYYAFILRDSTQTDDRSTYRQLENTLGLLGRTDFLEYRVYGRYRSANWRTQSRFGNPEREQEVFDEAYKQLFVGGTAAFRWRKLFDVEAAGEYKFFNEVWLRGRLRFGPLTGEVLHSTYAPTLTQQQFSGNHHAWDSRGLGNTTVDQLTVGLAQRLGAADARVQQRVQASASFVTIYNLVYYSQRENYRRDLLPRQIDGSKPLFVGFVRHQLSYGILRLDNQVTYTQGGEGEGLRIPKLVGNSRIYAEGYLFKKALFSQIGVETYLQSSWTPYDYAPSVQQFYVQDHFTSRGVAVADVFLTADIKTVSVFLKMAYVNQGLPEAGYFPTPFYTGNPRSFQIGLKWNFFD
ncbi:putative porin [Hymenobacter sp. 15J16-1T3B]|uniref:putative porin n=1 Tax=Hymenobacter sp. 15J16-1T3B TaxID=2886941 RepID=UPI001D12B2B7|nr:putative porin [Hymenobacter sp. 15J16-1T3B]MCC3158911.1 putative porin [Hymenobacter sp. 15J16-1T3B]